MSVDRDDYEPIEGNPRRNTKKEDSAPEDSGGTKEESPSAPSGAQSDGAQGEGTQRGPEGTNGAHPDASKSAEGGSTDQYTTSDGRTKRVKVTPQDWRALEEAAERLGGLPHSKVYNRAFQELRKKLGEL